MPTGKVKWYDSSKGFGFVTQDGGADVYVRSTALPSGVTDLKSGQRVEFGVADGRRGPQALSVRLLESRVQPDLRRGRYPDRRTTKRIGEVVRAVAQELDP
ncbi:MAG: cold-shock protein [Actinomycetota bacterium]|nr:cold-shock protein [Actinomycetota bacterium]